MTSADLLVDAFGRIRDSVHAAVADLTPEQLAYRVNSDANSIAWLVWHLTRIQDDHIAGVAQTGPVWTSGSWVERFGFRSAGWQLDMATAPLTLPRCGWSRPNCSPGITTRSTSRRSASSRASPMLTFPGDGRALGSAGPLAVRLVSVISDDLEPPGRPLSSCIVERR